MSSPVPGLPVEERPPQTAASMDLLRQLMTDTVDPDYAAASRRRDPGYRTTSRSAVAAAVVLLGLLVAAAAVQRARSAPQLEQDREALVAQIVDVRDSIALTQDRTAAVRADVQALQGFSGDGENEGVGDSLAAERMWSGAVAVSGPGLRIVVDDAPDAAKRREGRVLDTDLQVLVNGLWESGAEAIAINGNRLGPLSAIRVAGEAITVNYRSLSSPYVVEAIGDPASLQAKFIDTAAGQTWLDLQANFGLEFRPEERDDMTLPAAPTAPVSSAKLQGDLP